MLYNPIKNLGQNFLINSTVVYQMVDALDLVPTDTVIEIGAGLGALTQLLADRMAAASGKIYVVEIDERFIGKLNAMFLVNSNVEVVQADILDWLPKFSPPEEYKIIGSLPFYITSPIIHRAIRMSVRAELCVYLVQKEVAQKLCAKPPKATYLSSYVQSFYDCSYVTDVSRDYFDPRPNVDGAVIKLTAKPSLIAANSIDDYEGFLHKGFAHPRKMLNKAFTKEELAKVGIDGKLRAQNISPQEWQQMFLTLKT